MSLFNIMLLLCLCTIFISSADFASIIDEDKLVLSPVELVDMVLKERMKNHELKKARLATTSLAHRSTTENAATELNDDENTLKRRKVWSRWGKWGECSVTCGGGAMTRQRVCVAGRCAGGELEQQRRSCARPPCTTPHMEPRDTD